MDYDDNDFQSQHFQLVGEDNNNLSTGLCSFALPKFDLDDHLQLRFDSLVEPGSFLGIQAHERNSWIDELSAGSSVIGFPSSVADSCSVLRHNNVWSEATSNESVEMLLKAVGEDAMTDKSNTDSDIVAVLDSTCNQMSSCPENSDSNMEGMMTGDTSNVQTECCSSVPESNESTANDPSYEATYQTQAVGMSEDKTSGIDESFEAAGLMTVGHYSPGENLPVSPDNFFDDDKKVLSEDQNYEQISGDRTSRKEEDLERLGMITAGHYSHIENLSISPVIFMDEEKASSKDKNYGQISGEETSAKDEILEEVGMMTADHYSHGENLPLSPVDFIDEDTEVLSKDNDYSHAPEHKSSGKDECLGEVETISSGHVIHSENLPLYPVNYIDEDKEALSEDKDHGKMSGEETSEKGESFEGVGMQTAALCGQGGDTPLSPVKLFSEDKEASPKDEDYGHRGINEKAWDHSHALLPATNDCSGGLAQKDLDMNPLNTSQDLSLSVSTKDVLSLSVSTKDVTAADPDDEIFDNQVGYSKEASQADKKADLFDTDKSAHGSNLTGSVNLTEQNRGSNASDFRMDEHREEVVKNNSDGLLDVVINQTKVLNDAGSQDNPFEELEDVCSLGVYSHEEKEENDGDSSSFANTTVHLVSVYSHGESTKLTSSVYEGPEKPVTMMEEKQESYSCHDPSSCDDREVLGAAAEAFSLNKSSKATEPSDFEEHRKLESDNDVSTVSLETVVNKVDNASKSSIENMDSSIHVESTEVQFSTDKMNEPEQLSHMCAAVSGMRNPIPLGSMVLQECARSFLADASVLHAEAGESVIQTMREMSVQDHKHSSESLLQDSCVREKLEGEAALLEVSSVKEKLEGEAASLLEESSLKEKPGSESAPLLEGSSIREKLEGESASLLEGSSVRENLEGESTSLLKGSSVREKLEGESASVLKDSSVRENTEGRNALASQTINRVAPDKPEECVCSPPDDANIVVAAAEKMTLPVVEYTTPDNSSEKSPQNASFPGPSVYDSCNDIQTASLQKSFSNSEIKPCSSSEQPVLHDSAKDVLCSEINSAGNMPVTHAMPQTTDSSITMEKDHPSECLLMSGDSLKEPEKLSGDKFSPHEHYQPHTASSEGLLKPPSSHSEAETPSSFEPSCSSPAVISGIKDSHNLAENDPVNQRSSISEELPVTSEVDAHSDKGKSVDGNPREPNTSEDDRDFSFKVGGQSANYSEKDGSCKWENNYNAKTSELDQGTPSPAPCQHDSNASKGEPQENQQVSRENLANSVKRTSRKEKTKLGTPVKSGSAGPSVSSKRKSAKESPISRKKTEKREKLPETTSTCSIVTVNKMLPEEMPQPSVQGSNVKTPSRATLETPKLPDLNTASATALFIQPFTDSQQVQLRAQIFVYGSLIQGMPPDESIMISAFGDPDGGRALWDGAWRAVVEKHYNKKSPLCETPARPVIKGVNFAPRCSPLQSKTASTPQSYRAGIKSPSPAIVSSSISLPPSAWTNASHDTSTCNVLRVTQMDSSQAISPMQAYLSPQVRQQTGSPAPWLPQSTSAPWAPIVNSSTHDVSFQLPILSAASSVRLPQIRDSAVPRGSTIQLTPPSTFPTSESHPNTLAVKSVQIDANKVLSSPNALPEQRSRKRKKDADSDVVKQLFSAPHSQSELNSSVACSKPATITIPAISSASASSNYLTSTVSPIISPSHFQIIDSARQENKVIFSEETCSKVEQAKLLAEDAAAFAAAAVRHSESIWSQLALQRNAGLISEVEQKLASSAAAAAAAVAVAKAAAAAAKVAADSALQAKLMADEAATLSKAGTVSRGLESSQHSAGNSLITLTPAAISAGFDKANSSAICAAREGVRRRVEAASAAAKRAEILDAIVKAAELAAGAVSHAGALVALPDPLPFSLSDILDAGPQDYWKSRSEPVTADPLPLVKADSMLEHAQSLKETAENVDPNTNQIDMRPSCAKELSENVEEENSLSSSKLNGPPTENDTDSVAVPSENEKDGTEIDHSENNIQEGSIVEVASVENGLEVVWHSARILDIKDGQAYVCYNTLLTNDGSDKLKEWIPLECDKESAPRIRIARPSTTMKNEGTRKRGREAVTTYLWAVGDRVDAWLRDGWCEGVIIEKSHLDESKLTVRFSDEGESSIVRSWDLRPSLVWVNGQWTEWARSNETLVKSSEGDTPREKRQKRRKADEKPISSANILDISKSNIPISGNLRGNEDCGTLPLSASDKIFSAGQATREETNTSRIKRTGLQKEGSKVIFGVPKPGRRRKFMDVSKHCVVDKAEKVGTGNELVKTSKNLMPQSSHETKNGSRAGLRDKQATNQKVKTLKSAKSQLSHTRHPAIKEGTSTSLLSTSKDEVRSRGRFAADKVVSVTEAKLVTDEKQIHIEVSNYEDDKHLSTDDNLDRNAPGSEEPRRSNRRIQPTSRLLEGLQSSMIISKIPSFSHDRGGRAIRRTGPPTRGRSHG